MDAFNKIIDHLLKQNGLTEQQLDAIDTETAKLPKTPEISTKKEKEKKTAGIKPKKKDDDENEDYLKNA